MQALGLKLGGAYLSASPSQFQRENGRTQIAMVVVSSSSSSSSNSGSDSNSNSDKALSTSSSSSSSSFLSRSQTYALLKQQMAVAAKSEDYKVAARIRDSLKSFEAEEPVLCLRGLLRKAVEEERFEGIRVQVRSVYIEGCSIPSKGQYFFAYRIRITNNSGHPVQLLRRHWIITDVNDITDANGKTENIWGVGVIGEQPVILPKAGFECLSACPLCSPNGRMEGDFEMKAYR